MKKLLSCMLATVMLLGTVFITAPVLKANASDPYARIYAYLPDGSSETYDNATPPQGMTVAPYNNSLFDHNKRFLSVTVTPDFADKYAAVEFETHGPEKIMLYIQGDVTLSAKKMDTDGYTYYAAVSSDRQIEIYPAAENARLYIGGSYKGDKQDAPIHLIHSPEYVNAYPNTEKGWRLNLQTYLDMRNCKDTAGLDVSPANQDLFLDSVNYKHTVRSVVPVRNQTVLHLDGSVLAQIEFNGAEGAEGSVLFKKQIFMGNFCGVEYFAPGNSSGTVNQWGTEYHLDGGVTGYRFYEGTLPPSHFGKLPLPEEIRVCNFDAVVAVIESEINYGIGNMLRPVVSSNGLRLELEWRDAKGNDCTGKTAEPETAYTLTVTVGCMPASGAAPAAMLDPNGFNTFGAKPEQALSAELSDQMPGAVPKLKVNYPAIKNADAPVIVKQPEDAVFYVTESGHTPETLSYSVKAERAVSYQWYGVAKDDSTFRLSDGDVYSGTTSNVLRVTDPSSAVVNAAAFVCAACAPLYPEVRSEPAKISRFYRINTVSVSNLNAPAAGETADTAFAVCFTPSWSIPHTASVEYLDGTTGIKKTSFADGDKINVCVTVTITDEKYVFQPYGMTGLWNGQMVYADFPEDDFRTAAFTFVHTVKTDENVIDVVSLVMDEPEVGKARPSFSFPEDAPFIGSATLFPYDGTVKPGVEYTLTVTLAANPGRSFSEATVFTLNGRNMTPVFKNEKKTVVELTYVFAAKTAEIEVAELFAVIPKIGDVFDSAKCSVETTGAEKNAFRLAAGNWEIERDKEGKVIADFSRGLRQTVAANEGYRFTPSTAFAVHYKDDEGKDAVLILNNDLTADSESADLLIIFDPYPPVHEHTWAVCYQIEGNAAEHEYTCKYCHEYVKEPHTPGDWIVDKPASAAADGAEHKECTACGYVLETAVIPKTGGDTPAYTLGDVDGIDGVTAEDARLALRATVSLEKYAPGSREFLAADVDLSGTVTAADARLILRRAVKLTDEEWGGGKA